MIKSFVERVNIGSEGTQTVVGSGFCCGRRTGPRRYANRLSRDLPSQSWHILRKLVCCRDGNGEIAIPVGWVILHLGKGTGIAVGTAGNGHDSLVHLFVGGGVFHAK